MGWVDVTEVCLWISYCSLHGASQRIECWNPLTSVIFRKEGTWWSWSSENIRWHNRILFLVLKCNHGTFKQNPACTVRKATESRLPGIAKNWMSQQSIAIESRVQWGPHTLLPAACFTPCQGVVNVLMKPKPTHLLDPVASIISSYVRKWPLCLISTGLGVLEIQILVLTWLVTGCGPQIIASPFLSLMLLNIMWTESDVLSCPCPQSVSRIVIYLLHLLCINM